MEAKDNIAMYVQHNMMAMNTARQGKIVSSAKAKSIEKLSSGYRVNRAADDAAGLAISEKLRSQVRGLTRASQNALDGISLIQTAEGALNEVHSILQRMNELSVQAANDTNTSVDRKALQAEVDQLASEIDRISDSTEFNTKKLLCGVWQENGTAAGPSSVSGTVTQGANTTPAKVVVNVPSIGSTKQVNGTSYIIDSTTHNEPTGNVDASGNPTYTNYMSQADYMDIIGREIQSNTTRANAGRGYGVETRWTPYEPADGSSMTYTVSFHAPLDFKLQVGAQGLQGVTASIDRISANSLGVDNLRLDSYSHAGYSIKSVQDALDKVSTQRSALGAAQNRLEHTIYNLDSTAENTQAAESRIRDTDMAQEMVNYSKQSILEQVGQSILSQVARSNEGVLALLQ